ncbi:MAG: hypothetical protein C4345_13715 [Chloroflexota bacterium]
MALPRHGPTPAPNCARTLAVPYGTIAGRMFQRVLVPLDGSPFGEASLPLAEAQARAFDACLILLHVVTPAPGEPICAPPGSVSARRRRERNWRPLLWGWHSGGCTSRRSLCPRAIRWHTPSSMRRRHCGPT